MQRRDFLHTALAGLAPAPARPNIVLVMADDLGCECLGCYGGTSYRTPNLDRMAASGVRFTHAYAQPLCTPTRIQVMTGRHNFRNWKAFGVLDPRERTFGHVMREAGYKTCIAGKWQLYSYNPPDYEPEWRGKGMRPEQSGFDEYSLWHAGHTEDKGSRYADPVILENGRLRKDTKGRYGEDVWLDFIGAFMEKHRARPFFVYYPMALTHAPFNPTPHSRDWADPAMRLRGDPKYFADMVEYMDDVMGRLVKRIDSLGLAERTLVLFYSDNGTPRGIESRMGDRVIRGGKGLTTDAGTHVPLIAQWKGTARAGLVTDELVDSTDFLPSIAEAAGVRLPPSPVVDGVSFLPQLRGGSGRRREWIYSHFDPRPGWDKRQYRLTRSVRDRRFKLYDDGRLYDVAADPLEQKPLDPAAAAGVRRRFQAVLKKGADAFSGPLNGR